MVYNELGGGELDYRRGSRARGLQGAEGDAAELQRILSGCVHHRNALAHSGLWSLALASTATSSSLFQTRRVLAG